MLRKENLLAFSALWLLISISIGYALGQFIIPELTTGKEGLLGWDDKDVSLFNFRLFLMCFGGILLLSPILHAIRKKFIPAGIELVLIVGMVLGGWWLSENVLLTYETESGFLGFNESQKTVFDPGLLLLFLTIVWGAYLTLRYILELAQTNRLKSKGAWIRIILLVGGFTAVGFYFVGMHRAIFHSTKFWVFEEEVSLIDSVTAFFQASERFLGIIIITFTLIFPMIKFIYMFWGLLTPPTPLSTKISKVLSVLGKYSMLDVFVVALLILNLKFHSEIIDMQVRQGAIYFGISIVLNMVVTSAIVLMGIDKLPKNE